ncbi:DUF1638 domain-containing protein [Ferruginivarius sediminum]|uniref:DUF1638 domain-containing protein n=1 Tax=Ferruginivarius sediminum TaxID=2661937 RepID=A0A369T7M7_9PROT|nr:DUF1638 domain-containing protein [Ferruginivarius sediminum]RDD60882.1 DUF1638 domain-containing protein [Ferruginivarius sediminum]
MAVSAATTNATARPRVLLLACGALAREVIDLIRREEWSHMEITCLPAIWHNTPQKIPDGVRQKIRAAKPHYDKIYVLYADCGTGGLLDRVLEEEGVERLPGPHCYATFATQKRFNAMADDDPTCFYLTDFLTRHFERFIIEGLGIDRHPELAEIYFGNYSTLVYLAQTDTPELDAKAQAAAARLGLAYRREDTGYGELKTFMKQASQGA